MQACGYCGRENRDDVKLCNACGTSLAVTPEPELSPERVAHYRRWGLLGLAVGVIGLSVVLLPAMEVFFLPAGTPVRPMAWSFLVMVSAALTFLIGLPCALVGFRGGQRLICSLALVLAFAPWPTALIVLQLVSKFHYRRVARRRAAAVAISAPRGRRR